MCVVIDANVLSCVLCSSNELHEDFLPILKWILLGKAKMSLGGKLYTEEIAKKQISFLPFIKELIRLNKIHLFNNAQVESMTNEIQGKITDSDFDDPHIIALLIVSKATILCSNDCRLFKYVHMIKDLNAGSINPKIYTSKHHKPQTDLLCDENICSCGDHHQLSIKDLEFFKNLIDNKQS